ncbi:acyl-ACP--UDP-N-acetylglucosamine O-acyltransferase [Cerasicoccus arenae]|uniref:Acyl-[acyl-carrier-protein]--UDP-N-acetylglucosamine O-acyltransferase n=1 Tax=Cerasicoccus arenae TaxID=424488 RepID=A0A8J3GCX0_9BACT|nr:acyl-ACP--UDP-N-acetylglucosamine O-acyltransferase [Cerasicoccus arenae]MBK1857680.1 acyl-ACP--UDP-N-acetylglucosamine O-acyltransferase [Cerasicoccus arenae]GHB91415.1 acyl-[acyl-carrier-protein]--UDP-N-acetylglucosamine O-acyltransferase [Cerasicoccus arenae]
MADIHPTAIIESGAQLADDVSIGAYAYIGAEVVLGSGCVVRHHATVEGYTLMGAQNEVWPYAMIGGKTHDLKFNGGKPGLKIGDRNVFREYVTVHGATKDGEFTTMGNDNVILAYSHIAHDCHVGNHLVMSSHAAFGGHVVVGDRVNIGWNAGIHQFCRLGDYAMVGACAKAVQDVPPLMIADGNPAEVKTINKVGLERDGFASEEITLARSVFKIFYRENLNRAQALERLREHPEAKSRIISMILNFAAGSASVRGWV